MTSPYFSFLIIFFFFLCISTFSSSRISATDINGGALLQVEKITKALSDAGYEAMSLTLQLALPTLLNSITTNNTTTSATIFSPPDQAFFSLKYPQPPLTLLQYHVVPMKLERETLESTGYKIDTLLPGHSLVATTLPHSDKASINEVEINKWDVYNDGAVVVHGVDDFFDPAYQTIRYPWYDHANNDNNNSTYVITRNSSDEEIGFGTYALIGVKIATGLSFLALYTYGCLSNLFGRRRDAGYVLLGSGSDTIASV